MTPQDYDDIHILKHAARDLTRGLIIALEDSSIDDIDYVCIAEKSRAITRVAELIGAIIDNGKHLPNGEEAYGDDH